MNTNAAPGKSVRLRMRSRPTQWALKQVNTHGTHGVRGVVQYGPGVRPVARLIVNVADATYDFWRKP